MNKFSWKAFWATVGFIVFLLSLLLIPYITIPIIILIGVVEFTLCIYDYFKNRFE